MKSGDAENSVVSAKSMDELNKIIKDMIEQGWESEGSIQSNEDGTFSQRMKK